MTEKDPNGSMPETGFVTTGDLLLTAAVKSVLKIAVAPRALLRLVESKRHKRTPPAAAGEDYLYFNDTKVAKGDVSYLYW